MSMFAADGDPDPRYAAVDWQIITSERRIALHLPVHEWKAHDQGAAVARAIRSKTPHEPKAPIHIIIVRLLDGRDVPCTSLQGVSKLVGLHPATLSQIGLGKNHSPKVSAKYEKGHLVFIQHTAEKSRATKQVIVVVYGIERYRFASIMEFSAFFGMHKSWISYMKSRPDTAPVFARDELGSHGRCIIVYTKDLKHLAGGDARRIA